MPHLRLLVMLPIAVWLLSLPVSARAEATDGEEPAADNYAVERNALLERGKSDPGFLTPEEMARLRYLLDIMKKPDRKALLATGVLRTLNANNKKHMKTVMFAGEAASNMSNDELTPAKQLVYCKQYAQAIRMNSFQNARLELNEKLDTAYSASNEQNDTVRKAADKAARAEFTVAKTAIEAEYTADVASCKAQHDARVKSLQAIRKGLDPSSTPTAAPKIAPKGK